MIARALVIVFVTEFLRINLAMAQAPPSRVDQATFDVASVKASNPSEAMRLSSSPGRFVARSVTLRLLITLAYGIKDFQLLGTPSWVETARYDVEATTSTDPSSSLFRPMLQNLLADRFGLTAHTETRNSSIYQLVVAKSGLKLPAARDEGCVPANSGSPPIAPDISVRRPPCGSFAMTPRHIAGGKISLPLLAYTLSNILGQTVVDRTGVSGTFDVDLQWAQDSIQPLTQPVTTDSPSIFTALQEQLGLTLEPTKGTVEVLVVDHVEKAGLN